MKFLFSINENLILLFFIYLKIEIYYFFNFFEKLSNLIILFKIFFILTFILYIDQTLNIKKKFQYNFK